MDGVERLVEMEGEQSLNGWLVGWDVHFPELAHFLIPFLSDRLVGGSIGSGFYSNLLPSSASDRRWMVE